MFRLLHYHTSSSAKRGVTKLVEYCPGRACFVPCGHVGFVNFALCVTLQT